MNIVHCFGAPEVAVATHRVVVVMLIRFPFKCFFHIAVPHLGILAVLGSEVDGVDNYAIISLALLGFCLPFLRKITGDRIPKIYQNPIFAILIGLIFGISANFPPLAVLAAIILAKIWQLIKSRKSSKSHRVDWRVLKMEQWEGLMFGAMIAFRSFKHLR